MIEALIQIIVYLLIVGPCFYVPLEDDEYRRVILVLERVATDLQLREVLVVELVEPLVLVERGGQRKEHLLEELVLHLMTVAAPADS